MSFEFRNLLRLSLGNMHFDFACSNVYLFVSLSSRSFASIFGRPNYCNLLGSTRLGINVPVMKADSALLL